MLTLKQRQERAARRAARIAAKHEAIRAAALGTQEGSTVMKKNEVKVGGTYLAKVSDKVVPVRIDGENPHGGWDATNEATGKKVHIKSAQRLRGAVHKSRPLAVVTAAKEAAPTADVGPTAKPDAKVAQEAKGKKPKAAKPKGERKPGILTLAADVLKDAKAPMDCKTIIEKVLAKGVWQTKGKTPAATLYAAIIREIAAKGKEARFHKTDRGMFELIAAARK
jgi:hypothetical protein